MRPSSPFDGMNSLSVAGGRVTTAQTDERGRAASGSAGPCATDRPCGGRGAGVPEDAPSNPTRLPAGASPAFDAYFIVDWSAASVPAMGADSVWWALLRWAEPEPSLETGNCRTRLSLAAELTALLRGPLAGQRVLVGFDFPLGYPRGFAAALGHGGPPEKAWSAVWTTLRELGRDDAENANNRFEVAAKLNSQVSGGFGPFFGRPKSVPPHVAAHLSPRQQGSFEFPLRTLGVEVHDRLQVMSTALAFARLDAEGLLEKQFAAPGTDAAVLHEEGWILGVPHLEL